MPDRQSQPDRPPLAVTIMRRGLLGAISAVAIGSLLVPSARIAAAASGSIPDAQTTPTTGASGTCTLTPALEEGPYFRDLGLIRGDIAEGQPGVPLQLRLTVLNAATCQPLPNATVDVWQANASGVYSGFDAITTMVTGEPPAGNPPSDAPGAPGGGMPGTMTPTNNLTFLRGAQVTEASGNVTFQTIYPGWYRGRTPHIHVKVRLNGQEILTTQLFFPEDVTSVVYSRAPYAARGPQDTTNATDMIFQMGGARTTLSLTPAGAGYTGTQTLAASATPQAGAASPSVAASASGSSPTGVAGASTMASTLPATGEPATPIALAALAGAAAIVAGLVLRHLARETD